MSKLRKKLNIISVFGLVLLSLLLLRYAAEEEKAAPPSVSLASDEVETVDIVTEQGSDYALIFSSDENRFDTSVANGLSNLIYKGTGKLIRPKPDISASETELEILIGNTDRKETSELLSYFESVGSPDDFLVWGYAYINGKLLYTANSTAAFSRGQDEFLAIFADDGTLSVPSDLLVINFMTVAEYEEELRQKEETEKENYLQTLRDMNAAFTDEEMGVDKYQPMIGEGGVFNVNPYTDPWVYPTANQHPRYFINESSLERIRRMLDEEEFAPLKTTITALAKEDFNYGVFPGTSVRYDAMILARIEARAFMYLLTGEEQYALEAVIGIKNAMKTLLYTTALHPDPYHGPDHVMRVAAEVYDWCYYALTESDRWQIIAGVATILAPQMEAGMQYPPTGMNGVSGHGTGPQFLQVWMSVAVAFYDDAPDWWDLIGGRYFYEYLPVANEIYKNGWISQGMGYGDQKLYTQLCAAFLIKTTAGENFLIEDAKLSFDFALAHLLPNDNYFETGDEGTDSIIGGTGSTNLFFLYAALYNDPTALAWAKHLSAGYTKYTYDTIETITPVNQLALAAMVRAAHKDDRSEGVDLISYFKAPAGLMVARDKWCDEDAVVIRMDIGDRTMANHDIFDHGSFQIYYKGLLAGKSGAYHKYGSPHHQMYTQQTVSQNGILVFNPALAADTPSYNAEGNVSNYETYYYSGGQRRIGEAGSLSVWLTDDYTMAQTTGVSYGYFADGRAKYAYIAGDTTKAYDKRTVDYVGRRMLVLFTSDEEMPAVFVTFDQIKSDDESFTKTFLLHTLKEPTIDAENKTATVTAGEGRLYLTSLFGADEIVKIGGEGKAWWINGYYKNDGTYVEGKNLTDTYHKDDLADLVWGRIELKASGEKETSMLTVMGITDVESDKAPSVSGFKNEHIHGAVVERSVIVFVNSTERSSDAFSFETECTGLYEYYVSGVETGTWQVFVDGVSVAFLLSKDDGGFLCFKAPAGEVSLKPCNDVIGVNGGRIEYVTNGGVVPADAPCVYRNDAQTALPTEVQRSDDVFLGWYTSPTYEEETKITHTPTGEGVKGKLVLYAKWFSNFTNEDFTKTSLHVASSIFTAPNGITYQGYLKEGAVFRTLTDENGTKYLEWIKGKNDPIILQQSTVKNFSGIASEEKTVSFTFKLAPNGSATPSATQMRLLAKVATDGTPLASAAGVIVFSTDAEGNVKLGTSTPVANLHDSEITTIRIAVDFKNGEMRYYDDDYNVAAVIPFSAPEATKAQNTEELLQCLTEYLWYWYAGGGQSEDASLRVYGMRVQEGDEFAGLAIPQTEGIKYNTGGGKLSKDAKKDFNTDGSATPLTADVEREGYLFAGWYTTPTFDEGTQTVEAPAGSVGLYEVYARWYKILVDESYEKNKVGVKESSSALIGGINYNAGHSGELKPGSSFYTETDSNGNTYLKISVRDKNALMTVTSNEYNMTHFTETAISFTLDLAKIKDVPLSSYDIRLASTASNYGYRTLLSLNGATGEAKLVGSAYPFARITEEVTTVVLVVDFEKETLAAFDENGKILDTVPLGAVPEAKTGYEKPENWLAWQSVAASLLFYGIQNRPTGVAAGTDTSLYLDNLKVVEGRIFEQKAEPPKTNLINYELNGGELSFDAPKEYDKKLGTTLPLPEKESAVFAGWYTTSTFEDGTRVEKIGIGAEENITVYAKWYKVLLDEDFDSSALDKTSSWASVGKLTFNCGAAGSAVKTEIDEQGNKYVKVSALSGDAVVFLTDEAYNLTHFTETAISYSVDLSKVPDTTLVSGSFKISTASGNYGQMSLAELNRSGEVYLFGSKTVLGNLNSDSLTLRLTVDFAKGVINAYGEGGEILDSVNIVVPNAKAGYEKPETALEWQKIAAANLFYFWMNNPTASTGASSYVGIDNLVIAEGRIFDF